MKYFIVTDIHGSAYWAQKVVDAYNQSGADMLVILGDLYNHGPRNPLPRDYAPTRVAEILAPYAHKIVAITGNCDSVVDQMISNFTFVQNNIVPLQGRKLFATHGHVYNKDNLPYLASGDVMVYGHFHINEIVVVDGVVCVNVGSPSLPKDDTCAYCIVDDNGVGLYTFDGQLLLEHRF